eukprot:ANDGO_04437.mRNA.1 Protein arv1
MPQCVHCGASVPDLYTAVRVQDDLRLTDCTGCRKPADPYIELELIVILLDVLLLRPAAFRHLLRNTEFTTSASPVLLFAAVALNCVLEAALSASPRHLMLQFALDATHYAVMLGALLFLAGPSFTPREFAVALLGKSALLLPFIWNYSQAMYSRLVHLYVLASLAITVGIALNNASTWLRAILLVLMAQGLATVVSVALSSVL